MFEHQYSDAPEGTLGHDGYKLHLAWLRFIVTLDKATGFRARSNRLFALLSR